MPPTAMPPERAMNAPATRLAQLLGAIDEASGGVVPPLNPSTTFLRDPDNRYRKGFAYGRDDNPGVRLAEAVLASLEGGAAALLWGSGMAAATAAFQAMPAGTRVVAPAVMYWGLRKWLRETGPRLGLDVAFVDMTDLAALEAAVAGIPPSLVWVETPANPTWAVTDLAAAAGSAHAAGALLAVDNTVPTPLLTRPIEHGADLVMHSATKYLNGHSDVIAGVLVTARLDAAWERLGTIRHDGGAILGAFEAWLLLRGLRTLHLRVRQSCAGAMHLAAALQAHARVERVLYPGLPTHPGHTLAARQMTGGFGGMLSIVVVGGAEAAIRTAARVRVWKRATSLGGVESLIEHRASIEGEGSPAVPGLLRLSVGIEEPGDLIGDLEQALQG